MDIQSSENIDLPNLKIKIEFKILKLLAFKQFINNQNLIQNGKMWIIFGKTSKDIAMYLCIKSMKHK